MWKYCISESLSKRAKVTMAQPCVKAKLLQVLDKIKGIFCVSSAQPWPCWAPTGACAGVPGCPEQGWDMSPAGSLRITALARGVTSPSSSSPRGRGHQEPKGTRGWAQQLLSSPPGWLLRHHPRSSWGTPSLSPRGAGSVCKWCFGAAAHAAEFH